MTGRIRDEQSLGTELALAKEQLVGEDWQR